jgi:hypothetical protein
MSRTVRRPASSISFDPPQLTLSILFFSRKQETILEPNRSVSGGPYFSYMNAFMTSLPVPWRFSRSAYGRAAGDPSARMGDGLKPFQAA